MRWLRRGAYALLALAVVGVGAYWWLFVETHTAPPGDHAIEIAEVRRLADALPGERVREVRVETVTHLSAPATMVIAGASWQHLDLPVSSYELVYGDHVALVDAAMPAAMARAMSATSFDTAAWTRVSGALARASLVVVTHEHPDHVGGLLAQPDARRLLGTARLTREQVDGLAANLAVEPFASLHLPANFFAGYRPLDDAHYVPVAPGVVLIRAPGHTPGSQMVYVKRADGVELLFLGDVAWTMRSVTSTREKARMVAVVAGEDRAAVREELAALGQLHAAVPGLHMVPGHDAETLASLLRSGVLVSGF